MASRFKPVSLTHYPQLAVRSGGALIAPPMPELTRRRFHKAREETWHIYYGDVHADGDPIRQSARFRFR